MVCVCEHGEELSGSKIAGGTYCIMEFVNQPMIRQ
jgi:hypothetical protein